MGAAAGGAAAQGVARCGRMPGLVSIMMPLRAARQRALGRSIAVREIDMAATLRDCIYGQAVADALGVPYEFRARGTFACTDMVGFGSHHQPAGTWSDDTSMALCICDSFRELGHIGTEDIRQRFVRWYREGAYTVDGIFDIGGACARS